jgi:hypothetical protein
VNWGLIFFIGYVFMMFTVLFSVTVLNMKRGRRRRKIEREAIEYACRETRTTMGGCPEHPVGP